MTDNKEVAELCECNEACEPASYPSYTMYGTLEERVACDRCGKDVYPPEE